MQPKSIVPNEAGSGEFGLTTGLRGDFIDENRGMLNAEPGMPHNIGNPRAGFIEMKASCTAAASPPFTNTTTAPQNASQNTFKRQRQELL